MRTAENQIRIFLREKAVYTKKLEKLSNPGYAAKLKTEIKQKHGRIRALEAKIRELEKN
jgi:hypothetical protein